MRETLALSVPPDLAGKRLDQALAALLPDHSRSRIQHWIDAGEVLVNGQPGNRKLKLWGGEALALSPQVHPAEQPHRPEAIDLDIVHEDAAILVLNKPAGLVVHPGAGNWDGTLLNALLHFDPALEQVPRAGIVHRLDKDTSGLMVVARTLEVQTRLVRDMQARAVKRVYWAVAMGRFAKPEDEIDAPIGRHPTQRTRMAVVPNGKAAQTRYRVLSQFHACAWVECALQTGRTHQIRVHLAQIGHPLLGDPVYAGRVRFPVDFARQALHAFRLGLAHPQTGEWLEWSAPMPADMQALMHMLEHDDAG